MINIPPPIWAMLYLAIAGALSVTHMWKSIADLTVIPLGIALTIAGVVTTISSVMLFVRRGAELNPASETHATLVVSGPFHFTRNPMYLGLVVLTLGIAFWAGSLPMFTVPVLVFATANWVHIPFEEERMRRDFAEAYKAYALETRRWL